jgi:hypothetical protein
MKLIGMMVLGVIFSLLPDFSVGTFDISRKKKKKKKKKIGAKWMKTQPRLQKEKRKAQKECNHYNKKTRTKTTATATATAMMKSLGSEQSST